MMFRRLDGLGIRLVARRQWQDEILYNYQLNKLQHFHQAIYACKTARDWHRVLALH